MSTKAESPAGRPDPALPPPGAAGGPRQLGDFKILEEIGRGGMGVVYKARQVSMDRCVALKVLPSFAGLDPDAVARFQREAEAAGRLSHSGIVPVYAVGETNDTYYYAMELVEGPSLFDLLESLKGALPDNLRGSLAEETALAQVYPGLREAELQSFLAGARYPASCAAIALEVTHALAAAHDGKVIHRDMKPSNLLLHPDGRVVIVDFGLARDEMAFSMTRTGDAVGTPSYMAPEQAAGCRDVDGRVDVYGLGATLYEMLTLRPPFEGPHSADIMRQILEEDPVPVRRINSRVPRDLETIVLHCLAKDPERRYQDIKALQHDLGAFLRGEPIRAKRPHVGWYAMRWAERNRRAAYVGVLSLLFALFVGLMVGLVSLNRSQQSGREALDDARAQLLAGRPMAAHAAYGKALGLLKNPKAISSARLEHLKEVFDTLYVQGKFDVLESFLAALPAAEADLPEYHEFRARLRGHGHLQLPRRQKDGEYMVWVRGLVGGKLEDRWRRLPLDGRLPVGQYLAKIQIGAAAPIVQGIEVRRDRKQALMRLEPFASQLAPGMSLVTGENSNRVFAIDTTELTRGSYAGVLQSIDDPEVRAEMLPPDWKGTGKSYMPMTGVSFRQARTAAAILGKHLPNIAEYQLAATGGLRLRYPWGTDFDVNRVVGDPSYTSEPQPANSKKEGAAPCGARHLVGNVAEILAPDDEGRIFAAGGHYLSRPDELTVQSLTRLVRMDIQQPQIGFRLAAFLTAPDDPEAASDLQQRMDRMRKDRVPFELHDWMVMRDGRVILKQSILPRSRQIDAVVGYPRGFRDSEEVRVEDRLGKTMPWRAERHAGSHQIRIPLARRANGRDGFVVQRTLVARSALIGSGDGYTLRVPLRAESEVSLTRVILPNGCHVDQVWPAPSLSYHMDGMQHLLWEASPRDVQAPERSALVRFRRDGTLTSKIAALSPAAKLTEAFFVALNIASRNQMVPLITDDFRWWPEGLGHKMFLARLESLDRYEEVRVQDAVAVGDVISVEVVATKSNRNGRERVPGWPLRLLLHRTPGGLRVMDLMPRSRLDLGRVQDRVYRHDRLKVDLEVPKGVLVHRTSDALTEMQVLCLPAKQGPDPASRMIILGCYGTADEALSVIRDRLTTGSAAGRPGQRVAGSRMDFVGPDPSSQLVGKSQHWLLRVPQGGGWIWERWTFLDLGNRHFLLRAIARGHDRQSARVRFRKSEAWFASIAASLRIR